MANSRIASQTSHGVKLSALMMIPTTNETIASFTIVRPGVSPKKRIIHSGIGFFQSRTTNPDLAVRCSNAQQVTVVQEYFKYDAATLLGTDSINNPAWATRFSEFGIGNELFNYRGLFKFAGKADCEFRNDTT